MRLHSLTPAEGIHASLRPEHIIVGSFGEVFVTTWGLARILPPEEGEEGTPTNKPVRTRDKRRGAALVLCRA